MDEAPAEIEEGAVGDLALLEPRLISSDAGDGTNTARIPLLQKWRRGGGAHCRWSVDGDR